MSLENAPDEVKLAVDLIMLLENHEIPTETVLKALEIVRRDFEGKLPPHPALSPCTVRGHSEHLFGDMVDTYN
ncbi:hypothetical protein TUM17577_40040 [Enterobacter asburiae]|nr:hypothetical protein TUM17577_40040 [Enterobacter asburiae]